MKFFLGIDGGQSSTTAVIGDETGRVLGTGIGGPCNHAVAEEGRERLRKAISETVAGACRAAALDPKIRFAAACCGMSGGPDDKRAILESLIPTDRLLVTTDAVIALAGATESGRGIIVIAGTGSMAFGRNEAGVTARAGGWGYLFGDEGSAFDMVRQALRFALRMEEGWGPVTVLRDSFLAVSGCTSANELMHRFYDPNWPRDRIAALAPLVDQAAANGDQVAQEILQYAALQLATLAASVRHRLWAPDDTVAVAYTGGVFQSTGICQRFQELVELEAHSTCSRARRSAAEGALAEALRRSRDLLPITDIM